MKRLTVWLVVAVLAGAGGGLTAGACSDGGDTTTLPPTGGSGGTHVGGAGASTGTGGDLFGGGSPGQVESIEISPADPVIVVTNGVPAPASVTFTAVGRTAQGTTVPVTGQWSYNRYDVAGIDSLSGELIPTGFVGGSGTVTFDADTVTGTTNATVRIHITSDPDSVPAGVKGAFAAATLADPSMALLYPYNETVFPRGLTGPTIQWNGGAAGDVYYLHATSTAFEFEAWGTFDPPSRYPFPTVPSDVWRVLTDSTEGTITLDVQRYDGSQAYLAQTQTWTIAPANLAGAVYYWAISQGDVVRLKMGDAAPESFLQRPANHTCTACHSVAANGSRLVATVNGSQSPWVTFDAETGAVEYDSRPDPNVNAPGSGFQAISPEGDYVLWRHWNEAMTTDGELRLSTYNDSTVLATLNPGTGGPSHPVWSTDGTKIAFSLRAQAGGLYFTDSDLWIADVSVNPPGFSNIGLIVDNDATRPTLTYPSFSPGSDWIAFMRGTHAYCDAGHLGYPVYGEIWLTNLDGTTQIALDKLNGTGYVATPDESLNYQPSFLPVAVGGYMWVVIATERNYGNTLSHAAGDLLPRYKQLWVAAIDPSPTAGQDPSHPAFWLPGQDLATENMRGQWALDPCKQIGEECEAGYECCDGFCRADEAGVPVCQDQPGPCSMDGDACTTPADCCDLEAQCLNGFCTTPPPQ